MMTSPVPLALLKVAIILVAVAETVIVHERCPPGTVAGLTGTDCYRYDSTSANEWHAASIDCLERGGQLASPSNRTLNDFLTVMPNVRYQIVENALYWLGGYADSGWRREWRWQDGRLVLYANWEQGQPSCPDTYDYCLAMDVDSGKWCSVRCSTQLPYICNISVKAVQEGEEPSKKNGPIVSEILNTEGAK